MTASEKNRLLGIAFLVMGVFHLVILLAGLFGFTAGPSSLQRPAAEPEQNFTQAAPVPFPANPNERAVRPGTRPEAADKKNVDMATVFMVVYLLLVVFVIVAGGALLAENSRARMLAVVASIVLLFFYPLGTLISIYCIWFMTGDEGANFYAELKSSETPTQSII